MDTSIRFNYTSRMRNRCPKIVTRALLLVLLFAMQGLCHAHAIDHHFDDDTSACVVCSLSGSLNDAIAADATTVTFAQPAIAPGRHRDNPQPPDVTKRPLARSPPLST